MTSEPQGPSPYEVVLADLRAKRAQIDQAIATIEALIAGGANIAAGGALGGTATVTAQATVVPPSTVMPGMFLGYTVADAARKVLEINKKTMSTREILDAITAGGIHLTSETPTNTVQTVLGRQSDIIKVARGMWALASWYPNSGRFKRAKGGSGERGAEGATDENTEQKTPSAQPKKPEAKAIEQSPTLKVVQ